MIHPQLIRVFVVLARMREHVKMNDIAYLYPSCPPGVAGSAHLPAILGRIAQAPAASRVVACPPVSATKITYPATLPIKFLQVLNFFR